jgi:hypothetical protein
LWTVTSFFSRHVSLADRLAKIWHTGQEQKRKLFHDI